MKTAFILFLLMVVSGGVNASLIGDEIDVGAFNSGTGTRITGFGLEAPFVVAADDSDTQSYSGVFLIDVGAEGFALNVATSYAGSSVELRFLDLDWVGMPDGVITGLVIDTNLTGWNDANASFTDHSASFDTTGTSATGGEFFNVTFVTDHSVPAPGSLALLALGIAGIRLRLGSRTEEK